MQSPATPSSTSPNQFALRTMRTTDMEAAHRLTLALKWPHRLDDWQFVQALGSGFVIENQTADNTAPSVAGSGLVWRYGTSHAALGMVIVANALQGLGLGRQLMERLLAEAGERSVLLNATLAGQPLYEKLGFVATGKLHQHQGSIFQAPLVALPAGVRIRPLGVNDTPRLLALDQRSSGLDRSAVITALMAVSEGIAIAGDSGIIGFALVRRFGHGRAIGPVVAPDAEHAKALISHWINTYSGTFMRVDVPEHAGLSQWLSDIGLTRVDTVVSMCKGSPPQGDPQRGLYALINQALG